MEASLFPWHEDLPDKRGSHSSYEFYGGGWGGFDEYGL
jgi:hypothetical protein